MTNTNEIPTPLMDKLWKELHEYIKAIKNMLLTDSSELNYLRFLALIGEFFEQKLLEEFNPTVSENPYADLFEGDPVPEASSTM